MSATAAGASLRPRPGGRAHTSPTRTGPHARRARPPGPTRPPRPPPPPAALPEAQRAVVEVGRLVDPLRPQQGDGLREIADIAPAQIEEGRIDALLGDRAGTGSASRG